MVNKEILRDGGNLPCGHSQYTMCSTIDYNWLSCLNCGKQFARVNDEMVEIELNPTRVLRSGKPPHEATSEYVVKIKKTGEPLPAVDDQQEKARIHHEKELKEEKERAEREKDKPPADVTEPVEDPVI